MTDIVQEEGGLTSQEVDRLRRAEAKLAKVQAKARRQQERIARGLSWFIRLQAWIRWPVLILAFCFYSPPAVLNIVHCMRVPKTKRLKIYSYPPYLYAWVPIVWGLLFCAIDYWFIADAAVASSFESVLAWWYMAIVIYYGSIIMGFDFKVGAWFGKLVAIALLLVGLGWIGSAYNVPIFRNIGDWMMGGWLSFPETWFLVQNLIMAVLYLFMMTLRRFNKRLRISGNLVIVDTLMGTVDRLTRASYNLRTAVPDVNELIGGLATAFELEGKGTTKDQFFKNVPGGPLVTKTIEEMLAATAVEEEDADHEGGDDDGHDELSQ